MENILSDQMSTVRKDSTNKKLLTSCFIILLSIQIVERFVLHLSPYFVFTHKNMLGSKKMKQEEKGVYSVKKIKLLHD